MPRRGAARQFGVSSPMRRLTREQHEVLESIMVAPDGVLPHQQPSDAGFSLAAVTELTRRGYVHRTHRGLELTTTGREVVQPRARPDDGGRGIAHHFSRG